MNLIAYPAWTCGGLFCDIFNKTMSPVDSNGGIGLPYHKGLLIVHGNDTSDNNLFRDKLKNVDLSKDIWVGTHTYPDELSLTFFNKVIVVNLTTPASITLRYARILHQCVHGNGINGNRKLGSPDIWKAPIFPKIDAKNVDNIEFEDVVSWGDKLLALFHKHAIDTESFTTQNRKQVWTSINKFLYDEYFVSKCKDRLSFTL